MTQTRAFSYIKKFTFCLAKLPFHALLYLAKFSYARMKSAFGKGTPSKYGLRFFVWFFPI